MSFRFKSFYLIVQTFFINADSFPSMVILIKQGFVEFIQERMYTLIFAFYFYERNENRLQSMHLNAIIYDRIV